MQDGTYTPLVAPAVHLPGDAKPRATTPALEAFVDYYVENDATIAEEAQFIPLSEDAEATTLEAELAER